MKNHIETATTTTTTAAAPATPTNRFHNGRNGRPGDTKTDTNVTDKAQAPKAVYDSLWADALKWWAVAGYWVWGAAQEAAIITAALLAKGMTPEEVTSYVATWSESPDRVAASVNRRRAWVATRLDRAAKSSPLNPAGPHVVQRVTSDKQDFVLVLTPEGRTVAGLAPAGVEMPIGIRRKGTAEITANDLGACFIRQT